MMMEREYIMDQYPGGGSGTYEVPQGVAPAYVPAPKPKKKLWIWIAAGGGALVVILVLVLVLTLGGGGNSGKAVVGPMIYTEDGDAFLAVGAQSIPLDDAGYSYGGHLNAIVLEDGSTMFYMADVSESSGEGDMMRIQLGSAKAEPEIVAEDVYGAEISDDGGKILYVTDVEGGAGDLYICTPGRDPQPVDESVYRFSISPNGKYVYYTVVDDDFNETLYLYSGGEPEEVMDIDEEEALSSGYIDDSGRILFTVDDSDDHTVLYLYANGNAEKISKDTGAYRMLDSAVEFFYVEDTEDGTELYYYNAGEEVCVTKEFDGLDFPTIVNTNEHFDRHFVYQETSDSGKITLYECVLPESSTKMLKVDGSYSIDPTFKAIAYSDDGELCLARKSGSSWEDVQDVCDYSPSYRFDENGRYLYYISADDGDYVGDLCRIPATGGEEEILLEDVTSFLLAGGKVYAINEDGEAYLVTNPKDSVKIEEDIISLYEAASGIYLTGDDGELYYYNGGEAERISRDASTIGYSGYIAGGSY
jgi:hypothetical protein